MSSNEIDLTFEPSPVGPLAREPVTIGVPFPPGALGAAEEARLFAGQAELFCQRQVLSSWPDGSVRGLNLIGLTRDPSVPDESVAALKEAFRVLYRSGLSLKDAVARLEQDSTPQVAELAAFLKAESKRGIARPARRGAAAE